MNAFERCNLGLKILAVMAIATTNLSVSALIWPSKPLGATVSARPMTMLVASKDHKFFYEAYNDASDINGDGTLDTHFKPGIEYYGLYDSKLCYQYVTNTDKNQELFQPVATAVAGVCSFRDSPGRWSGNWLNYITTSRIDALKKVLYGGTRDVDTTTETVLRRTYIPQDAHSWGKEYHSSHGYKIGDYTPLSEPTATTKRHFFGNLTANRDVSCATLNNCSNLPPLLRIRTEVGDNKRVYEWASKERPVLHDTLASGAFPTGTGAEQNFTVRAKVCVGTFMTDCKEYVNGTVKTYKPFGLLHEYGENESMLFGLLGGSYDQHMSGGRLRKVVSSFANEINPNTGQFLVDAKIVNTFNALRIRGFNQSTSNGEYWKSSPYADSAKAATEGQLVDWGNPIAEMMYEATRYFSGTKTPTSSFNVSSTMDTQVGLSSVTWDDPYESTSAANAPYCSRANFLAISDINPSFDSDSVPGSVFNSYTGDLTGLDVSTRGNTITSVESNITGLRFIGQSSALASSYDAAPTAKTVTSLGSIRGLAPEEPTKQGSYYSASVAYHAKTTDLRPTLKDKQSIDTYVVALSSPLPRIEAWLPNGKSINVVPFSKSVSGSSISATKGDYQPTNQIVDFFVETIANASDPKDTKSVFDTSINGGRYYAEFLINFEDVEQGGDHDMDAIARYVVQANVDNTLSVTVTPTYQAGGIQQVMGYVISGTSKDGVYLVARDESSAPSYFLNVPFDTVQRDPGYCDVATPPSACSTLPTISSPVKPYVFTPDGSSASLLRDPLWYAAKYGGFINRDNIDAPNLRLEWDADNNGVPDTYFLVQNPLKLREALKRAFDNIIESSGSGGNIIANSTVLSTDALVYQATFNSMRWSGDLAAYPVSTAGVGTSPLWNAAAGIPAATARKIYYHSGTKGEIFTWRSLSPTEKAFFSGNETLFDYVTGVRTSEIQNGGALRDRSSTTVLGDISHSSPVFVKDTNTVYVGANDGMLHAFDSKTGTELFAHIPSSVMPRLKNLADPNFNVAHEYYVDGDIAVSSKAPSLSSNYLVSTLGRGGKGLFALDVSTPTSFSATDIKWERFNGTTDGDLGYMLGRPVIARMNGGTWVVIVGNGYNSTNGRAVLYILDLATGAVIRKFDTLAGSDNGMATPGLFDSNNDGLVDVIYSGDLKGNLWKFDVSSSTTASWSIANGGLPIFVASDSAGKRQPITAPITVAINNVSTDINFTKRFVFFGTGSYFQTGDPTNTDAQTWYSVIDESATLSAPVRSDLVQRTISASSTFAGKPVRVIGASTAGDMASKRGCFIDLPAAGERMVSSSRLFSLAEITLIGSSIIPVIDQCVSGGIGFLNAVNPFTCARLTFPFFDVNDNGDFLDDVAGGAHIGSIDLGVGMPGEVILVGDRLAVGGSEGKVDDIRVPCPGGGCSGGPNSGPGSLKGRLSWREIVRD